VYAAERERPSRAHLDAEYAAEKFPARPATEPMFTIEPPPESFISLAQAWMPMSVPVTLTSNTRFHSSIETSGMTVMALVPTMFMSTWSAPALLFT
jgi:acyl dehydratase